MPIYEYRCGGCRKKFEKIVLSGGAPQRAVCPKCGASEAERLVSRFATAAKGSGGDAGDFGDGYGGGDDEFEGGGDGGFDDEGGGGGFGGGGGYPDEGQEGGHEEDED